MHHLWDNHAQQVTSGTYMAHLTFYERQQIAVLLKRGLKLRWIAERLGRDHSVISREVKRNKGQLLPYDAEVAERAAARKARKTNTRKLLRDRPLREWVERRLREGWSPEQIAGRLKHHPPWELRGKRLCNETIYAYCYAGAQALWGVPLYQYLRRHQPRRQPHGSRKPRKVIIPDRVGIEQRPAVVASKERYGDWESDTLCFGRKRGAVSVQYERKAMLVRLTILPSHRAEDTAEALIGVFESVPPQFWQTITFDNGGENVQHIKLRDTFGVATFFADSYAAWQKGGVENMNGLLRQYLPKRTNLATLPEGYVTVLQERLNNRPRKSLQYETPNEIFKQATEQNPYKVVH